LSERFNIAAGAASAKGTTIGGEISSDELTMTPERLSQAENLPLETARHLLRDYGPDYRRLVELTREDERLRERMIEGLPQILAEVVYAARYEMALTLADDGGRIGLEQRADRTTNRTIHRRNRA
jgi:glycerol-3-phosphate dehydrogenase